MLDSTSGLAVGAWTHVAFIKRGTTAEIFFDAQPAGSIAVFDYQMPSSTAECGFGSFHGMPSDADFDELAIYDVALTQAQLAAHVAAR